MTSTQTTRPAGASTAPPVDRASFGRIGLVRLTRVEMRKMIDTRSGFWLLLVIAGLSLLITGLTVFTGADDERSLPDFFQGTLVPVGILLPVLGILTVTTEWSQRTALATFSLVPQRRKIILAKLIAAVAWAVLSIVSSIVLAGIGFGLALALDRAPDGAGGLTVADIGGALLFQVIQVVIGVAFGMLFLNTPFAIVLKFVLPTALTVLAGIEAIKDIALWLDINQSSGPLADASMDHTTWQHLGPSVLLWIVVPFVLGWWRITRREIS